MKKIILSIAAVMAFGFANAQDVKYGAKAGLNMSNYSGDAEGTSSKIGFQIGAFAEYGISDKISIQPELLFSNLGAKADFEGTEVTMNQNYLIIPVMAKYAITDAFSLEAGPQIGFLMSAKWKAAGESVDAKDAYNSTDFGFNIGAGYDVAENINIGLRYSMGLSNIIKDSGDSKTQNSNIGLTLGYKF
jgi:opacity protein-like surface antigen